jgi:ketosteroid isomerase-like protein
MDTSSMSPRERVESFFEILDDDAASLISDLLSREFVYEFADTTIEGRESMATYLETDRSIRETTHDLRQVVVDEELCAVEGSVEGRSADGSPVSSDFVDVFAFDAESGAIERVAVYTR